MNKVDPAMEGGIPKSPRPVFRSDRKARTKIGWFRGELQGTFQGASVPSSEPSHG